jgi:hypothetical protein
MFKWLFNKGLCTFYLLGCFCFVFLSFVYSMLRVSLDCPFLISPSVFFNLYIVVDLLNSSYHFQFKLKKVKKTHVQVVIQSRTLYFLLTWELLEGLSKSLLFQYLYTGISIFDQFTTFSEFVQFYFTYL